MNRRTFLFGVSIGLLSGNAFAGECLLPAMIKDISPKDAYEAVVAGKIVLIDIRRPDEWRKTGIPDGAVPIDMRDPDFIRFVDAARGPDALPVAFICARGVRSSHVANIFKQHCYSKGGSIYNVAEGMLGSNRIFGVWSGWLADELPIVDYQ